MTSTPTRTRPRPPMDRKKKAEIDEALEEGLKVTLEGKTYTVRMGDVTSDLTRELRAKSGGMSFRMLMSLMVDDPDTDVIASFIWLARRLNGEDDVQFEDVSITYRQLLSDGFEVTTSSDEEGEAGDPEA